MSSVWQPFVLQHDSYISIAVFSAIAYDYILTLEREIEFIWHQRWTSVSTLFVLARYSGLLNILVNMSREFLPYLHTRSLGSSGETDYLIGLWSYTIFVGAADAVMVLRVYAMYRCSKTLLRLLLTFYVLYIILLTTITGINSTPKNVSVGDINVLELSMCVILSTSNASRVWNTSVAVLFLIFGSSLCILVIVQFAIQSIQMYRATKQWQLSRYMNLLVREGVLYFLASQVPFLFATMFLHMPYVFVVPNGPWEQVLLIAARVPMYTLVPRFIINIREMYYAHDVHHRRKIDTGFGFMSWARSLAGPCTSMGIDVRSAIVFANMSERGRDIDG